MGGAMLDARMTDRDRLSDPTISRHCVSCPSRRRCSGGEMRTRKLQRSGTRLVKRLKTAAGRIDRDPAAPEVGAADRPAASGARLDQGGEHLGGEPFELLALIVADEAHAEVGDARV